MKVSSKLQQPHQRADSSVHVYHNSEAVVDISQVPLSFYVVQLDQPGQFCTLAGIIHCGGPCNLISNPEDFSIFHGQNEMLKCTSAGPESCPFWLDS